MPFSCNKTYVLPIAKTKTSENSSKSLQSAAWPKRLSSETTRQLSGHNLPKWFGPWLAGVIDGDGNFDIRNINNKPTLKAIRIKLHIRDINILNIIKKILILVK